MAKFIAVEGFLREQSGSLRRGTIALERRDGLLYLADDIEPLPVATDTELRGWGRDDGPAVDLKAVVIPAAAWRAVLDDADFWAD